MNSVEYQWVRQLCQSGYSDEEIHRYIQVCFGGDDTFADLLRKVAIKQTSHYTLLQYLGWAPSSREFALAKARTCC
nr:hypothetical protein [Vibrio agarilyticus]